jgi:signal transduction histidine kinase
MQVLMNLQSNALKFTKEGGKINIICEYIRGKYKMQDPNEYKLIGPSKIEKLFKNLYSSDEDRKKKQQSSDNCSEAK